MRPAGGRFLRRVRRLGLAAPFSCIQRFLGSSPFPAKHVKIDDEEKQSGDHKFASFTSPWRPSGRILHMIVLYLLLLISLTTLVAYTIYKPPKFIINFLQWKYPHVLFHVKLPTSQRVVALSLDDAPSGETSKILDLLKIYGAKATFFVVGSQIATHPDLLQRMHNEGHEIGNHAWADEPSVNLPLSELLRQITAVEALIPANSNSYKYFRPGSGFFSKDMVESVRNLGYNLVLGSIYPHDPQIHNPRINSAHVLSMVRPGGIIIMHDRRSYSAEQLKLVLKGLAAGKWKVESVGGLLKIADEAYGRKGGHSL